MTPAEAVARLDTVLAHAWMVRTFLKHADEIQASEEMLAVPRALYDGIRAVEPARQRGDHGDYLRRLKGKLPKLRRAAEYFRDHFKDFSPHTNYEMASASLLGVVRQMEEVFAALDWNEVAALIQASQGREAPGAGPPSRGGRDCGEGGQGEMDGSAARLAAPTRADQGADAPRSSETHDPLDDLEIPEV